MPPASEKPRPKTENRNQEAESEHKDPENENQDVASTRTRTVTQVRRYSGPIPPAAEFARYEEIYPGSADRLFSMAEKEQDSTVKFRYGSLAATTIVSITSVISIAVILTANPESLVLVALAITYALPAITDFLKGIDDRKLSMDDRRLSMKERELEIQIRKDNHKLDMIAARKKLELPSGSDELVTQRARRLGTESESAEFQEGNQ